MKLAGILPEIHTYSIERSRELSAGATGWDTIHRYTPVNFQAVYTEVTVKQEDKDDYNNEDNDKDEDEEE